MQRAIFIALAALAAGAAAAQEPPRRDPTDPRAKVPPLEYRSAFAGYERRGEDKLAPWRESNDAVKGGGGHEGHSAQPADEVQAPRPPAGAAPQGSHR